MLALPFKQTKPVEWNRALHRFVSLNYSEGVADEHRTRFEEVHELRLKMEKIGTNVDDKNADKLRETLVKYHALLSSLSSRFGETGTGKSSMNVTFEWKDCFSTQHRSSQPDIRFERACVLWNLAAVTSVLGLGTRRLDGEGIKKACHLFQQAAGIISQVAELAARCEWVGCTADMSGESLECMQQLMLAQAQKCYYEKAEADGLSTTIIVKIAKHGTTTYDEVLRRMRAPKLKANLDRGWPAVVEWQSLYFAGLTEWHASQEHALKHQYGLQVGRLAIAHERLSSLMRLAKGAPADVIERYAASAKVVAERTAEATRDNDTVYNELVPAPKDLPQIDGRALAKPSLPADLEAPPASADPFHALVPFEILTEASVFTSRVDDVVREIKDAAHAHAQLLAAELEALDLPQALQACETDSEIPPKLRREIERAQRAGGDGALVGALSQLGALSTDAQALALSIEAVLDVEAGADAQLRAAHGGRLAALASTQLAHELAHDLAELRTKLDSAQRADADLGVRFRTRRDALRILDLPLATLAQQTPRGDAGAALAELQCTKALRALLDQLDVLRASRDRLVGEARALASKDDVTNALVHRGNTPTSQIQEGALAKYDLMHAQAASLLDTQTALLEAVRCENDEFTRARIAQGSDEGRQNFFRALNGAVCAYDELSTEMSEGVAFYTGLLDRLAELQQRVSDLADARGFERRQLLAQLDAPPPPSAPVAPAAPSCAPAYSHTYAQQPQQSVGGRIDGYGPAANSARQHAASGTHDGGYGGGMGAQQQPPAPFSAGSPYQYVPQPPQPQQQQQQQQQSAYLPPPPLQPPASQPPQQQQQQQQQRQYAYASPHNAASASAHYARPPPAAPQQPAERPVSPELLRALEASRLSHAAEAVAAVRQPTYTPPPPVQQAHFAPPATYAPPPPPPPQQYGGPSAGMSMHVPMPTPPPIPYSVAPPPQQPQPPAPAAPPPPRGATVPASHMQPPPAFGFGSYAPPPLGPPAFGGGGINPANSLNPSSMAFAAPYAQPPPPPAPPAYYGGSAAPSYY